MKTNWRKGLLCSTVLWTAASVAAAMETETNNTGSLSHARADQALREALERNPAFSQVDAKLLAGKVVLTGTVAHYQDKLDAESAAREATSIPVVQDRITVSTPVKDDMELEAAVQDRLRFARADEGLSFPRVQVSARNGIVYLSGTVKDPIEHAAALSLAGTSDGVLGVRDRLAIDPDVVSDESARIEVNKAVYRANQRAGEPDVPIRATFHADRVTLTGFTSDPQVRDDLVTRIQGSYGHALVEDRISVPTSPQEAQANQVSQTIAAPCARLQDVAESRRP